MNSFIKVLFLVSCFIAQITYAVDVEQSATPEQLSEKSFSESLKALHNQWGIVNYTLNGDEQEQAFKALEKQSIAFNNDFSDKAETWIWLGIVQSSFAGSKGGLGALSLVKSAKKSLEKALTLDDKALLGSGYTSLGTLCHKVPGWPISFGDDDDAIKYLKKALSLDPNGIDPNYFYGELLYDKKQYNKAMQHLMIAKNSPIIYPADEYRKADIQLLIGKVEKKLVKKKNR